MAVLESPLTRGFGVLVTVCLLIISSAGTATAQGTTDPIEVTALNTILSKWGQKAPDATWNITGEPCSGSAIDNTELNITNPGIKCDCTYDSGTTCHIIKLRVFALNIQGTIPDELQNLKYLIYLNVDQNYLTGPVPAFFGNLTQLAFLSFNINALSGPIPKEWGNLKNLTYLGMGINNFSGSIPEEFGNMTNLQEWWTDSAGLSGDFPETLSKLTKMQTLWANDNDFTGKIPEYVGTNWTNMTDLRIHGNYFQGPIPSSFSNLVKLTNLRVGDITNGTSSTLNFISNMTSLRTLMLRNCKISDTLSTDFSKFQNLILLDLSFNNITGEVPQSLFNLSPLAYLFLGNNSLSGSLPSQKSLTLINIDLSYNFLSGSFPSWANNGNLQMNLVANNFNIQDSNSSVLPSGLQCLQRDFRCRKGSPIYYSFAINCGGARSVKAQDGTVYQSDNVISSGTTYYVTDSIRWGVSNVGAILNTSYNYLTTTSSQIQNTLDSELFQSARMSTSSLRYYGFGLENGNYTVNLQFAEIVYPNPPIWESIARRVFDIFIQGSLREKDFDIRKNTHEKSFVAVVRNYTVPVTNNFIEIHFFWTGKGTYFGPTDGYYGPSINAISVEPFDFKPTVSNREPSSSKSQTSLIVGVVVGVSILGLITILAVLYWRHMKKMSQIDKELVGIVDRPNVFSYAELRTATEAFSANNILGGGGYGPVYKGKLSDGRSVAVKQLAVTSQQGKREFLTEISIISAVQHKNLVKLYGCCIEGNNRLLVYEFLENGSLDQALFGKRNLYLDWATRFDICIYVARGLAYLHEESSVRIVHRDIKASNILLDSEFCPKISDFGLAKLYEDDKTHISTRIAGTIGYLAPEYAMRGHLTEKTDVFSFGVVVLEVVTGRSNTNPTLTRDQIYLLEWAWSLYEQNRAIELVDPKLTSYDVDQALRLISISLLCTQASPRRPSMSRVVAMLTGDLEVNKVNCKPSYLTDWHFQETTDNNSSTREYCESTTQRSGNRGAYTSISHSNSSYVLMDSIIQEGR